MVSWNREDGRIYRAGRTEQHCVSLAGKFVRIAPNHVSIADPAVLNNVYGHGQGTLKPEYYDGECRRWPLFER